MINNMAKILVVEDDPILQKMYASKLQKEGYETFIASDGQEGFDQAKKEMPDFILLDLMMPKTDGAAALRLLKDDEETKGIPVAILSVIPEDTQNAEDKITLSNAVAYWRKDQNNPSEITEKIKDCLNNKTTS